MTRLYLILIWTFCFILVSCKVQQNSTSKIEQDKATEENLLKEGYEKAIVIVFTKNDEDCRYLIRLDSNQLLETHDLPNIYKSSNMNVWLKFLPQKRMSTCGNTVPVAIIDIKKREE